MSETISRVVRCPHCGGILELEDTAPRKKGEGKATGAKQSKLSRKQIWAIRILQRLGATSFETAVPLRVIWQTCVEEIKQRQAQARQGHSYDPRDLKMPSSHLVGFWLSALLGARFTEMVNRECRMVDPATQKIRFMKKPCHWLSDAYQSRAVIFDENGDIIRKQVAVNA